MKTFDLFKNGKKHLNDVTINYSKIYVNSFEVKQTGYYLKSRKSINDLYNQLEKFSGTDYFIRAYFAYYRAFEYHFHCTPHTIECKNFIDKYGKDCKINIVKI